jgi:hypothetical protein
LPRCTSEDSNALRAVSLSRGARLKAIEAIGIAEQAAISQGYRLSEYQKPIAYFEFDNKIDKTWSVFFDTKDRVSKKRLVLRIDDVKGQSCHDIS